MSEVNTAVVQTSANTISKMIKAKVIQARQEGLFIQVKDIHDKLRPDGTNWNSRNMHSVKTKDAIDALVAHIQTGAPVPAIEVQPRQEGGVQKVDGYCRHEAYKIVDASGEGELWIQITPFKGSELEALARITTSGKNTVINPLEQLDNYKRIREQLIIDGNPKPSLQDVAEVVQVSRQYVDQIFKLDALDDAGKSLVSSGRVSVAVAVKAVRANPENATELLEEAARNAEAQGKSKATGTTEGKDKPFNPPTALLLDIHQIGINLRQNINKTAAAACESFLRGDMKPDAAITLPVRDVAMLLAALREGERHVEAAKAKADKAAQSSLDGTQDGAEDDKDVVGEDGLTDEQREDEAQALARLRAEDEAEAEFLANGEGEEAGRGEEAVQTVTETEDADGIPPNFPM